MAELPGPLPDCSGVAAPPLRRLGEYQLLEQLGQGAMGIVYRALHLELGRIVALKLLNDEQLRDERAVARFKREMLAVGKLDHPHIVRAYDAREIEGVRVLVMEHLNGLSLDRVAARLGPLPVADACELIRQAAQGLQHAHEHGLVHRDIKPSNLLLAHSDRSLPAVKILDLGLAHIHEDWPAGQEMTAPGFLLGTPDYMAPEQIADSHAVDIRADIYSLGCTLFHLLVGRPPFAVASSRGLLGTIAAHSTEPPPAIGAFRPDAPAGLTHVVARMLAKKPVERYGTPQEVSRELAPFCSGCDLLRLLREAEGRAPEERLGRTMVSGGRTLRPASPPPSPQCPPIPPPRPTRLDGRSGATPRIAEEPCSAKAPAVLKPLLLHPWRVAAGLSIGLVLGLLLLGLALSPERSRRTAIEPVTAAGTIPAEAPPRLPLATGPAGTAAGTAAGTILEAGTHSWILLSWTPQLAEKPDLWLFSPDGRIRRRVAWTPDWFETQPSFSPDGRRILFVRSETPRQGTSIWVCKVDGSGERKLVDSPLTNDRLTAPLWASDEEVHFTWLRCPGGETRVEFWRMALHEEKPQFLLDVRQKTGLQAGLVAGASVRDRELLIVGQPALAPATTSVYLADWEGTRLRELCRPQGPAHVGGNAIRSPDGRQIAWGHGPHKSDVGGSVPAGIVRARRGSGGDWHVEFVPFPETLVAPLGWSADGSGLLGVKVPLRRSNRTWAAFFVIGERFQGVHDLFDLPDWHMPNDLYEGRIGDWKTLPPDVVLPSVEAPPKQKPKPAFRPPGP